MSDAPESPYAARERKYNEEAERHAARSRTVSNLRGLSFAAFAICFVCLALGKAKNVSGPGCLLGLAAFIALVVEHGRVIRREDLARRFARVNRDALLRVTGRFSELAETGAAFADAAHPYCDDLDVFGPGSLFQRLSVAHTRMGQHKLAGFLRTRAAPSEIRERQVAVRELAPLLELRQRLEALALAVVDPGPRRREAPSPEPLLSWAESAPVLTRRPLVIWLARILPFFTVAGLIAWTSFGQPVWAFVVPALLARLLLAQAGSETARVFRAVSETQGAFLRYGTLLAEIESLQASAPLLKQAQARLRQSGRTPSVEMRRFERAVGYFELKHNGMIHPFVDTLLIWDVHCVLALEAWQASAGRHVREWLDVVGEVEALSSLAGLAHDEPSFAFPELASSMRFAARGLGHPLIDSARRVVNDVNLPEAGRALLVTGSNMSGKSTLLRSIGLASVLAFAGGPVCAESLTLSELDLITSMRISDSLSRGVSHFYAELKKLKAVVDAAESSAPVLFLLDEILHGTNSLERQLGARWVIGRLIARGAIGAVSTHDMGLCELSPDLMARVELVHFRESVQGDEMTFDYRMHEGPVQAGNALKLMRQIGLDVPLA
ncbi:MAG TPA: MutS family DNA mismatch repair protein [Polyangiaceae bacterium]